MRVNSAAMLLSHITRWAAPLCWLACLASLLVWFAWPVGAVLCVPLMFAGPGLLRGRSYTFAWVSLMSLFYMALGMTEAFSTPDVRGIATVHVLAAGGLFLACVLTNRLRAVEQAAYERNREPPPGSE